MFTLNTLVREESLAAVSEQLPLPSANLRGVSSWAMIGQRWQAGGACDTRPGLGDARDPVPCSSEGGWPGPPESREAVPQRKALPFPTGVAGPWALCHLV